MNARRLGWGVACAVAGFASSARADVTDVSGGASCSVEMQDGPNPTESQTAGSQTLEVHERLEMARGASVARSKVDLSVQVFGDSLSLTASGSGTCTIALPAGDEEAHRGDDGQAGGGFGVYFTVNRRSTFIATVNYQQTMNAEGEVAFASYCFGDAPNFVASGPRDDGALSHNFSRTGILEPGCYRFSGTCGAVVLVKFQNDVPVSGGQGAASFSVSLRVSPTVDPESDSVLRWIRPSGGPFAVAANWQPARVPAAPDTALFDLSNAFNVVVGSQTTERLLVRDGTVRFMPGADYHATGASLALPLVVVSGGAALFLTGGQLISNHALLGDEAGAFGDADIRGGSTWTNAGRLTIGEAIGGRLFVDDGGVVVCGETRIGGGAAPGEATVEDAGSKWTTGPLDVGLSSAGKLAVRNGGEVTSARAVVGRSTPLSVSSQATVTGAGSSWDADELVVGDSGVGKVVVSSGATLIVAAGEGSSGPSAGAVTIGRGGEGRLEILGAGTSANPTLVIAGKARVGQGGEGTLRVGAGGHFSTGGDVVVGEGSAGTILVDGGGLTITADSILGGRLSVGLLGGAGAVDVTSGGDVYVEERLFVGDTDGFGEMTIGAAGSLSRVRVVLDAHVGLAGSGVLGVLAQGRIEVGGVLRVHPGSLLYGNGVIVGQVVNQGVVAPGASPGTLTVEGDYTQDATGTLTIEVAGPTAGKTHDRLVVTGAATLDGPIVLQFMNGFAPKVGQTFDFVASPTAPSGAFSQVEVRGLEPGAQFATAFAGGKLTATTTATAKALPTVTIKANAKRTSERRRGRTTFTLTRLRGTTSAPLTVPLVVSGTALASVDYAAIPASVVIPAGRRTATIALTPIVDGLREPAETVVVAVRPSAESTHARASTARVAIVD